MPKVSEVRAHAVIRVKIADDEDNSDPARVALLPSDNRGNQERYARSLEILRAALTGLPMAIAPKG